MQPNYLSTEADCRTMIEGVKLARRLAQTSALGELIASEYRPGDSARSSLPVIGLLWNPRLLPFLYLVRLLLMMVGIVDLGYFVVRGVAARYVPFQQLSLRQVWITGVAIASVVALTVLVMELFLFREVPGGRLATKNNKTVYTWGIGGWDPITLSPTSTVRPV